MSVFKTATFVKDVSYNFVGLVYLYKVEPPMRDDYCSGAEYEYVVSSAVAHVFDTGGPEVYIFGANAEGEVLTWNELPGSFRGGAHPHEAIKNAGYEVVDSLAAPDLSNLWKDSPSN